MRQTHPQLKPGLALTAVGATSVVGMPYKQVIDTIKAGGRPLTVHFMSAAPVGVAPALALAPAVTSSMDLVLQRCDFRSFFRLLYDCFTTVLRLMCD